MSYEKPKKLIQSKSKMRILFVFSILIISLTSFISCSSNTGGRGRSYNGKSTRIEAKYEHLIETTSVKNQRSTGTCWAYSTLSFIESESIRKGIETNNLDLSEMFIVYWAYFEKSKRYLDKMGNSRFSEGGLDFDVLVLIDKYGIVRSEDYKTKNTFYHRSLLDDLVLFLDEVISKYDGKETLTERTIEETLQEVKNILNNYLGDIPTSISYEDKDITPTEYAKNILKFNREDYITITSFTHLPLHQYCKLNIPDNWTDYDKYINVELSEFVGIVNSSLEKGYSVSLDADVTEPTINKRNGYFILPDYLRIDDYKMLTEEREEMFESGDTTDDHAMHILGLDKDRDDYSLGIIEDEEYMDWYYTKNSWGEDSCDKGFVHISEYYFKLKALAVTVNKNALGDYSYILPSND